MIFFLSFQFLDDDSRGNKSAVSTPTTRERRKTFFKKVCIQLLIGNGNF